MLQTVTIETQTNQAERLQPLHPAGAVAATLSRRGRRKGAPPILYVAESSRRAAEIAAILRTLEGFERAAFYPRWDGFPADDVPPSVAVVGQRMSVLRWLLDRKKRPAFVVTTAPALMRRVPPRSAWRGAHLELSIGEAFDVEETRAALERLGYRLDERCDEPGEAAVHGRILEVFPAAAPRPCRIEHEDGRIVSIRSFDPVTQRSVAASERLIVDPASEWIAPDAPDAPDAPKERGPRSLAQAYGKAETVFDYLGDAEIVVEVETDRAAATYLATLHENGDDAAADFLDAPQWEASVAPRLAAVVEDGERDDAFVPSFASEEDPLAAFSAFAERWRGEGYRIVLAGPAGETMKAWGRRFARLFGKAPRRAADWADVLDAEAGETLRFDAPITQGFVAHEDKVAVVALRDLAGQGAGAERPSGADVFLRSGEALAIGDAVVHFDHGVGILEGLESVGEAETASEALRLRFADDATLLVPLSEIGALWRYGGSAADVTLDRLKGEAWVPKRNRIVAEIARTAEKMVALLSERQAVRAEPLRPDRVSFERFCARFPYDPTPGQLQAVDAVLSDLKSGRPMDRLLCGDVGFGKTEVALRAVAAAVFSGRQVAVVAPTTVLARQHFELFRNRFARDGIEVALLSRLQSPAEAKAVRARVKDGSVRVLVATHAICGRDVGFDDLALVVIDEEQRFGSRHKQAIRDLAPALHVLSMTATPIPRTLQAGFVGLHEISVIATPPVRRRPVRTRIVRFEDETVREALCAEKARGGQSFLVCPRIEDIEPMAARLKGLVPDLAVTALHGEMPAADVDKAMASFSDGRGDVLLATNIVESGLDVRGANTIVVSRPDRFGLAQLHQLRGRVGRGSRRGVALLATDPDTELSPGARQRLETLETLTALGSGFDIAARDLDLRGAGELLGEEQAGHLQMIGLSLYRRTLERALAAAHGEDLPDDWRTDLNIGLAGSIPAEHIPEPELRIDLAASLDRVDDPLSLERLRSDVLDRFGPMPDALATAFDLAALRLRATVLGIRRLDAGPKAVAATFSLADAERLKKRIKPRKAETLRWSELRLILDEASETSEERMAAVETLLERLD